MRCDQCEALMIQGVFCHEIGCININARYDKEEDRWIQQYKCFECGYMVDKNEVCSMCYDPFDQEIEEE